MTMQVTPVDLDADLDLIVTWVRQERAEYWGMRHLERREIADIYAFLEEQAHLAAYLIRDGGIPVALIHTWDPAVDEAGEYYAREPGDLGLHLFIGPVRRPGGAEEAGHTGRIVVDLFGWLLADPGLRRIVMEPDVGNQRSLDRLRRLGATFGPVVDLEVKVAQFAFLTRAQLERVLEAPSPGPTLRE